MDRIQALEMAEAFSTDCMNSLSSLGSDAEQIVEHCWEEIDALRGRIIELSHECRRLRDELNGEREY